jgi:hypothetical protein
MQDGICVSKGVLDQDNNNFISTAEAATLQLEFKYLSYLTDEDGYWRAAESSLSLCRAFFLVCLIRFCPVTRRV